MVIIFSEPSQCSQSVWLISLFGLIIPFFTGFLIVPILSEISGETPQPQFTSWLSITFLGISLSVTALPVLACVLSEKKQLQSKIGVLTLGAGR